MVEQRHHLQQHPLHFLTFRLRSSQPRLRQPDAIYARPRPAPDVPRISESPREDSHDIPVDPEFDQLVRDGLSDDEEMAGVLAREAERPSNEGRGAVQDNRLLCTAAGTPKSVNLDLELFRLRVEIAIGSSVLHGVTQ